MSAQEKRSQIIRDNLPKLISNITGFKDNEENFIRCENYAWYTIKNHKNLSVNSHEIKRKIEGMMEKFIVGNYKPYAEHLQKLCYELINHPLCINHYEVDIQWSVLEFLFNLSYNPVGALRKNKFKIPVNSQDKVREKSAKTDAEYWAEILKEDCIPIYTAENFEESDLSDWSESSEEDSGSNDQSKSIKSSEEKAIEQFTDWNISPPQKEQHYREFHCTDSKEWLLSRVQHTWWLDKKYICDVQSSYEEADFCNFWNRYLSDSSSNLIKRKRISTVTEYCLLREIIWMFFVPTTNKFFLVSNDCITLKENVSIPSVTVEGLKSYLETLIPYIEMSRVVRNFIDSVYCYDSKPPPKTYEFYAPSLENILKPFYDNLLQQENKIKNQFPMDINTLMQFTHDMKDDFQYLEHIYNIHKVAVLDYKETHEHICSAHLLSSLLLSYNVATTSRAANLALALFLSTVQAFCYIIDMWWTEGRLDDWRMEYLIEHVPNDGDEFRLRQYSKSKETSFFVATNVSKVIQNDSFLKLLKDHSLEASCTLNLLYQINKISELKRSCHFEANLYDIFLEDVLNNVKTIEDNYADIDVPPENKQIYLSPTHSPEENSSNSLNNFMSSFSSISNDEFLLMAFTYNIKLNNKTADESNDVNNDEKLSKNINSLSIFKMLNKCSKIILPLEEVVLKCMENILQKRISFTNNFVMKMYREEFEILKHLQNIRKVLLLESSDLMNTFYIKLFIEIESLKSWNNPFSLTIQLDDILCSKFPEMSSLFRVEIASSIKCLNNKVTEAVEELLISYDVKKELRNIITEQSLCEYNKIFCFLLKVKWGMWSLENLKFPKSQRKRPPYAEPDITDYHMRRLELLRFWITYSIQNIHFHLMTHVLQSMGQQLDKKIEKCTNLTEMKSVHESYIKTVCEHCFIKDNNEDIKVGIEQLLNLVYVLKLDWNNIYDRIEGGDFSSSSSIEERDNNELSTEIDAMEGTYIRCHQYLATTLNNEVYVKHNSYLAGLSAAFNTSIPY